MHNSSKKDVDNSSKLFCYENEDITLGCSHMCVCGGGGDIRFKPWLG